MQQQNDETPPGAAPGDAWRKAFVAENLPPFRLDEHVPPEIRAEYGIPLPSSSTEGGKWLRRYLANASPFLESLEGAQYSVALMATIVCAEIFAHIPRYGPLEATMAADFVSAKTWREGHVKKSFIYVLIDPRISEKMAAQQDLTEHERWRKFVSSIFYVGKGKSGRPYAHLHDAMKLLRERSDRGTDRKLDRILEIWGAQRGVVCQQMFHSIMPAEAFTREAAIIDAIGRQSLTNQQRGTYFGVTDSWPSEKKSHLGVLLLYKAMLVHLTEGESELKPHDLV